MPRGEPDAGRSASADGTARGGRGGRGRADAGCEGGEVGEVGEVGAESGAMENSASSYLGTALRCVGRRCVPPEVRFGSCGDANGSRTLEPEGERTTGVPVSVKVGS